MQMNGPFKGVHSLYTVFQNVGVNPKYKKATVEQELRFADLV